MNGLSLFSGIGGIDVALSEIVRPVAYCEIDPYCQSVLLSRMQTGDLPKAPIWDDIRTLEPSGNFIVADRGGMRIVDAVDIIYGGFPCQDISVAGNGKGLEGERSGLFFEIMRLAKEIKPTFIFLENVPAITTRGGLRVVREITEMGYDCRWCVISAASVGALHKRDRWFLLANSKREGLEGHSQTGEQEVSEPRDESSSNGCNTDSIASGKTNTSTESKHDEREAWREHSRLYRPFKSRDHWQKTVGGVCRTSDGVPNQVERLKALGNGVVPQQVRKAFKILIGEIK